MTLLLAVASCLLTAFILIALAMIFGGPEPLRDKELAEANALIDKGFVTVMELREVNQEYAREIARLRWVILEQSKEIDLKNSMVETLSNVVNDRTGRGGIGGLGGH